MELEEGLNALEIEDRINFKYGKKRELTDFKIYDSFCYITILLFLSGDGS